MLDMEAIEQRVQRASIAVEGRRSGGALRRGCVGCRLDPDRPRHSDHSDDREDRQEEERRQPESPAHRGGSVARAS